MKPTKDEKHLFKVEVIATQHGYVKVHARDKNEAMKAVERMSKRKLLSYFKERFKFVNFGEVKPQRKMIDILNCELNGEITEISTFEVSGTYDNEPFQCRVELRFPPEEDPEEYEHIDGADLGSSGYNVLEELIDEIYETENYQEAFESFSGSDAGSS